MARQRELQHRQNGSDNFGLHYDSAVWETTVFLTLPTRVRRQASDDGLTRACQTFAISLSVNVPHSPLLQTAKVLLIGIGHLPDNSLKSSAIVRFILCWFQRARHASFSFCIANELAGCDKSVKSGGGLAREVQGVVWSEGCCGDARTDCGDVDGACIAA